MRPIAVHSELDNFLIIVVIWDGYSAVVAVLCVVDRRWHTMHDSDLFGIIHPTEYPNLSVITSGSIPPNPSEILGSEPMIEFLNKVSQKYDYIIIDTPPINVVSDALPIIRESDGVVLVVRSYSSTHPELQKALNSLKFIDAKILGFVVNYERGEDSGYGSKYSSKYGYSKYGYGDYTY